MTAITKGPYRLLFLHIIHSSQIICWR